MDLNQLTPDEKHELGVAYANELDHDQPSDYADCIADFNNGFECALAYFNKEEETN